LDPALCSTMKLSVSSDAPLEVKGAFMVSTTLGGVRDPVVVALNTIWNPTQDNPDMPTASFVSDHEITPPTWGLFGSKGVQQGSTKRTATSKLSASVNVTWNTTMIKPHAKAVMDCRFDTRTAFPAAPSDLVVELPFVAKAETEGHWRASGASAFTLPKWDIFSKDFKDKTILFAAHMDANAFAIYGRRYLPDGTKLKEFGDLDVSLHTFELIGYCAWKTKDVAPWQKDRKEVEKRREEARDKLNDVRRRRTTKVTKAAKKVSAKMESLRGLFSGMLLVGGKYGAAGYPLQGVAAFGQAICLALRISHIPKILNDAAGLAQVKIETEKKGLIFSLCYDEASMSQMNDVYDVVREDTKFLSGSLGFEAEAQQDITDSSWLLKSLPGTMPAGFSS